jgi:hypothetical protein
MIRIVEYVGRYQGFRGEYGRLPSWARLIVMIAAVPGIILVGLSFAALIVSILALLLLTAPVYWALSALTAGKLSPMDDLGPAEFSPMNFAEGDNVADHTAAAGRRRVDVKVVDSPNGEHGSNGHNGDGH